MDTQTDKLTKGYADEQTPKQIEYKQIEYKKID